MRSFLLSLIAAGTMAAGCHTSAKTNGMEKREDGWRPLFDGKTTNGWHTYLQNEVTPVWKVVDGTLFMDADAKKNGAPGGDLVTDEEFENFELALEWKISEGGNSGIIFCVHEDPKFKATYLTGPEMQVLDDERHADGKIEKHNSGDLYDLKKASQRTVRPVGQWNEVRIRKKDNQLTFWLNGTEIVNTTMGSAEWNELVANSKFKTWEGFGKYSKGRIALQDHGDKVWYRNIRIRTL